MNYYERHLGDYARDTAHLSILEHGVYGLLLDRYYATEQGIPADQVHRLARARSDDERQAVDVVLSDFFDLVDGLWINHRAEEEITKAQLKIKTAQENGKRGGRPKKPEQPQPDTGAKPNGGQNETDQKPNGFSSGSDFETQQKAHQSPDTRHQEEVLGSSSGMPGEEQGENATSTTPTPTPQGSVAVLLRQLGIDASPALLRHPDFVEAMTQSLADWQIAAETAATRKPGERINARYLLPIMRDLLHPPAGSSPQARASPGQRQPSIHEQRASTIAALTGSGKPQETRHERTINAECRHVTD